MTTTLGSWIDKEALAEVVDDLCPRPTPGEKKEPEPEQKSKPERYAPGVGLEPGDLHRPELYGESKFPKFSKDQESVPLESIQAPKPARGSTALMERLASLRQRAERSGLIDAPIDEPAAPEKEAPTRTEFEFTSADKPLHDRLTDYVSWAKQQNQARHVSLTNGLGESLIDEPVPVGLPQAASLLASAMIGAGEYFPIASATHISLGRGQVLSTVAVREANEVFAIVVIAGAPLSDQSGLTLRRGLLAALQPNPTPS